MDVLARRRIGVIAAGVTGSLYPLRRLWRALRGGRRAVALGEPAWQSVPLGDPETGKLGMPQRLDRTKGGTPPGQRPSMRDFVNPTEGKIEAVSAELAGLQAEVAGHLAEHVRTRPRQPGQLLPSSL